jgi:hypothetical protein
MDPPQVEFYQTGQAFELGHYSLHYHLMGDLGYQQYVRGCSFHTTWNRALTVHGTHNVVVQDNVAFNVMGE